MRGVFTLAYGSCGCAARCEAGPGSGVKLGKFQQLPQLYENADTTAGSLLESVYRAQAVLLLERLLRRWKSR